MKQTKDSACVVLVTAPSMSCARSLAKSVLKERLAACANLLPQVESHYWWEGKLAKGQEVLLLFKTTRSRVAPLETKILATHPYDTPEFLVLSVQAGTRRYLDWMANSVKHG